MVEEAFESGRSFQEVVNIPLHASLDVRVLKFFLVMMQPAGKRERLLDSGDRGSAVCGPK